MRLASYTGPREVSSDGRREPCVAVTRKWFFLMAAENHALQWPPEVHSDRASNKRNKLPAKLIIWM